MGLSKHLNINSVSVSFVVSSHLRNNFRELSFVRFFVVVVVFFIWHFIRKMMHHCVCSFFFIFLIRLIKIGG